MVMTPNTKLLGPMYSSRHGVKDSNRDVRILKMIQGAGNRRLIAVHKELQNSWTGGWRPKNGPEIYWKSTALSITAERFGKVFTTQHCGWANEQRHNWWRLRRVRTSYI